MLGQPLLNLETTPLRDNALLATADCERSRGLIDTKAIKLKSPV